MPADRHAHGVLYPDVELICYDGDGTTWNTEEGLLFPIHREMLADRGHDLTEDQYRRIIGVEALQAAAIMIEAFGLTETPEAYMLERRARARPRLRDVPLMPGAAQSLTKSKASGATLAMVSAATREHVVTIAEACGVDRYFRHVITVETTERTKPHPDPYVHAMELVHAKPGRSVAFEDTRHGAESAYAAGMIVVGVPHRFSPREVFAGVAHYVLPDGQNIGDFDLSHIKDFFPQRRR